MFKKGDKVKCVENSFRNLTEDDVYDVEVSEYTGAGHDTFIQVKNDSGQREEFWASRFELVEEENKVYTGEDIREGMVLRCTDNKGFGFWKTGNEYIVEHDERGLYIEDEQGNKSRKKLIVQRLNGKGSVATMEVVPKLEEPIEEEETKEIALTIKGKTFYDIRNEAEELLNLVNSIIEASEELGISEEKVRRIYGGKTNE